MKTTNLSRKEAYIELINGQKISNTNWHKGCFSQLKIDTKGNINISSTSFRGDDIPDAVAPMLEQDGYFIYEPESTFKEVTMYVPVLKGGVSPFLSTCLYQTSDHATLPESAIGYTEVKVFLKSEGEDGK